MDQFDIFDEEDSWIDDTPCSHVAQPSQPKSAQKSASNNGAVHSQHDKRVPITTKHNSSVFGKLTSSILPLESDSDDSGESSDDEHTNSVHFDNSAQSTADSSSGKLSKGHIAQHPSGASRADLPSDTANKQRRLSHTSLVVSEIEDDDDSDANEAEGFCKEALAIRKKLNMIVLREKVKAARAKQLQEQTVQLAPGERVDDLGNIRLAKSPATTIFRRSFLARSRSDDSVVSSEDESTLYAQAREAEQRADSDSSVHLYDEFLTSTSSSSQLNQRLEFTLQNGSQKFVLGASSAKRTRQSHRRKRRRQRTSHSSASASASASSSSSRHRPPRRSSTFESDRFSCGSFDHENDTPTRRPRYNTSDTSDTNGSAVEHENGYTDLF